MTPEEREAAILSLSNRVRILSLAFIVRMPPTVHKEEIYSAAWRGAVEAVDRFKPGRATLDTFASGRIYGSIKDYLRSLDHLSRWERRKQKKEGGVTDVTFSLQSVLVESKRSDNDITLLDALDDPRATRQMEQLEARIDVERLLRKAKLKPRVVSILVGRANGKTFRALGKEQGVGESRAWQMHAWALRKLRRAA